MNAKQIEETIKFCAVIVDEAHLYVDPDNPSILKYMVQMTKTVRKFNSGMIFTTQNPGDFTVTSSTTEDASRIIQNSQYSVFFGLKDSDIEKVQKLLDRLNITFENTAYMGDDLNDLSVMKHVVLAGCPKDSVQEVLEISNFISSKNGGDGAVREFLEYIMKNNGMWKKILEKYSSERYICKEGKLCLILKKLIK